MGHTPREAVILPGEGGAKGGGRVALSGTAIGGWRRLGYRCFPGVNRILFRDIRATGAAGGKKGRIYYRQEGSARSYFTW
ncbi:hypothetical protein J6590_031896 [Homalodisca vitripennis]|nr:hypothetical protein J6590_031896 [Homalodisca vitripennis]